mmetsp:Transcript_31726/g.82115  ORF Transcript_31726/g.82115 Transcript_31726/m.82115 type:complete len:632 (+) Transcript_31726:248-2143(+)
MSRGVSCHTRTSRPDLHRRADQAGGIGANLRDPPDGADLALAIRLEPAAGEGVLHISVAAVDGREGDGADIEGVAGIVVELHLIGGSLLARGQHLPRLLRHGGCGVELEQAAAKGRACGEVLQLEEDGHGRAQRERHVDRLQLAVGEVGGHLGGALGVILVLLALDFNLEGHQVVLRDGEQLLHLVHLLAGLHNQQRDGEQDALKQLVGLRELALCHGLVRLFHGVLQFGQAVDERWGGRLLGTGIRVPFAVQGRGHGGQARQAREAAKGRLVGFQKHGLERREVDDAQLAAEEPHGGVKRACRHLLAGQVALLLPALLGRHPGGGRHKLRLARAGEALVGAHISGQVQVLHLPATLIIAALGEAVCVLHAQAVIVLSRLSITAKVQVILLTPASARGLHLICSLRADASVLPLGECAVEEALGDSEQRPVVLLEDGGGGHQQRRRRGHLRHALQALGKARRVLCQAVRSGGGVGQRRLPRLLKNLHALAHIAQVERVVEAAHHIPAHLGDLQHLGQFLQVAGDEVQERQALKVLCLLVAELHDLVVALAQRLHAQLVPCLLVIKRLRRLQGNLDVAALDGQIEAGALVFHKVQRNLREALLLQVGDDGLAGELRVADHGQHLVELALHEG